MAPFPMAEYPAPGPAGGPLRVNCRDPALDGEGQLRPSKPTARPTPSVVPLVPTTDFPLGKTASLTRLPSSAGRRDGKRRRGQPSNQPSSDKDLPIPIDGWSPWFCVLGAIRRIKTLRLSDEPCRSLR